MSSTFLSLTRQNEIGANSYLLTLDDKHILLDAGMHPKMEGRAALPLMEKADHAKIDAIFLTHAHHDHTGALPVMMLRHPDARVFMSEPTYYLADPLLHNSVNVMKKQRQEHGIQDYPLYTHPDVNRAIDRWQACHLQQRWTLDGHPSTLPEQTSFQFHHAGHILGSVAVEIVHKGRRILYTGDINLEDQTLMSAARLPSEGIDTLIIETTRGANPTPAGYSRQAVVDSLLKAMLKTFDEGGCVMIPIFAMGKTQEMLAILHQARLSGVLPKNPIFIGGLSRAFSLVYDRHTHQPYHKQPQLQLLDDVAPEVVDGRKINTMKPQRGHIYLISSGMMTPRTLSHTFAQNFLPRDNYSMFFVGYCDPDSPAGKLKATPRGEKVTISEEIGPQPVLCNVQSFDLTSHAIREDILMYIQKLNPRHCILVHGDGEASLWFKEQLNASHPGMKVSLPPSGEPIEM